MHRSHTVFAKLLDHCKDQPQRDAMLEGFGATAYAFREHPNATKPANPYSAEESENEAVLYERWREGSLTAEQYWHDWAELPTREREVWERGAQDWSDKLAAKAAKLETPPKTAVSDNGVPLDGAQACREGWKESAAPYEKGTVERRKWLDDWSTAAAAMWAEWLEAGHKPGETAPGSTKVSGYQPVTDDKLTRVNTVKVLEERVLRVIDALHTELHNEIGDIAADQAAFQDNGYKRMSVEAQKAKHVEFADRLGECQTALRWLAIGKTDIEKGFMAVNRSVFRPKRVGLPEDNE